MALMQSESTSPKAGRNIVKRMDLRRQRFYNCMIAGEGCTCCLMQDMRGSEMANLFLSFIMHPAVHGELSPNDNLFHAVAKNDWVSKREQVYDGVEHPLCLLRML